MKKIAIMLIMALTFISSTAHAVADTKSINAIITYYWPGEAGGKYDCDGNVCHRGVAAVDFDVIPKGKKLNIGNSFNVVASDCGGSAIISRKAAHERGLHCPVIDVWVHSESEARELESRLPRVVSVSYETGTTHNQIVQAHASHTPIVSKLATRNHTKIKQAFVCYNSKCFSEHARIERCYTGELLAFN